MDSINKNPYFLFLLTITISLAIVPSISSSYKTTAAINQLAYAQQSFIGQNQQKQQQHPNISK
jgi:hypothetical protein